MIFGDYAISLLHRSDAHYIKTIDYGDFFSKNIFGIIIDKTSFDNVSIFY